MPMKKIFSIVLSGWGIWSLAQQVESFTPVFEDKISIRAIELYDHKVWYSGSDSKFGYVDLKDPEKRKQIKLSDKKLEFRTLAQDRNSFYAINIVSPAYFFKIDKKDLKSQVVFTDTAKTAFYDALHFVNDKLAFTFSDAAPDNILKLAVLRNGKWSMYKNNIKLNSGEAAFAASNTNIASSENYLWIATGGKASRILRLNLKNEKTEVFETPFIQGDGAQGMYSVDFFEDQFGIAVGGDYTKQAENINNIATSRDAGKTWQVQASGQNAGYTTCVKIKPGSKGKDIISVGDQHISYSSDFGKTWKKISDEKGLFVCDWVDDHSVVFAGNGRIMMMKLKF